jgi:hypothetical protein
MNEKISIFYNYTNFPSKKAFCLKTAQKLRIIHSFIHFRVTQPNSESTRKFLGIIASHRLVILVMSKNLKTQKYYFISKILIFL